MSGTVYDQALRENTYRRMKDKAWVQVITETLVKLNSGFWDSWYVDQFFQKGGWMNQSYTIEDAYAFAVLHARMCQGDILACDLHIGQSPSADRMVDTNLDKLRRGLSGLRSTAAGVAVPLFDVDLWCGLSDQDGSLSWSPYLEFHVFEDGQPSHTKWVACEYPAPVEVGSQAAGKTLVQLNTLGMLARWPYGSDTVRVFYVPSRPARHFPSSRKAVHP